MGKKTYKHPRQYTTETFKTRLKEVYGDKFGLDFVEYNGVHEDIILVCPIHGKFKVRACSAARGTARCHECSSINRSISQRIPFKEIIKRISDKHPDYLIDENQNYVNTHTGIIITCPKHGNFKMSPNSIFNGQGCPKCGKDNMKLKMSNDINWLIKESNRIHGDKYSFEHFIFKNTKTKSYVTCKKHGDFLTSANKLIYSKRGCPHCASSTLETSLKIILEEHKENFIQQYRTKWLKLQSLDFYLPDYNIAIECQGIQHFEPVRFGGISIEDAKKQFEYVKKLDEQKKKLCKNNNVKILYLKYDDDLNKFYEKLINIVSVHN